MARTRKEATSDSGAYMSQYDQEVEVRLKSLEEKAHLLAVVVVLMPTC